jgi:hypothetical protein
MPAPSSKKVDLFMAKYATNWVDYRLPTGQEFAVAICGYTGKVRHMYIGNDPMRRIFIKHVYIEDEACHTSEHCLALDCFLNRSAQNTSFHMLDMNEDEPLIPKPEQWGPPARWIAFEFAQK